MKINISKSIYAIAFATLFASCQENFLVKAPESNLAAGSIKTAIDAENLLTGAYNKPTQSYYQYDRYYATDGLSDNCYINGDNVNAERLPW